MPTFPGWKTYAASIFAVLFAIAATLWPEHAQTLQGIAAALGAAGLGFLRSGAQKAENVAGESAKLAEQAAKLLVEVQQKLDALKADPAPKA